VEETFVDLQVSPSVSSFSGRRCMICGEILDPIILQNRTRHPEPQYGRARWWLGANSSRIRELTTSSWRKFSA